MNSDETTQAILLIDAAYGPKMKAADRDMTLVIEVWTKVLADIPWTPYGANALDWWLKHELWPPAPADIRERAKAAMKADREAQHSADLLTEYRRLPEGPQATPQERREILRRWREGEITAAEIEDALSQLVAQRVEAGRAVQVVGS